MNSIAKWEEGFRSTVDNGRNHKVTVDLPEQKKGSDCGPTALELTLMGLSGCISTIFSVIATNSKVDFNDLRVDVNDESPENVPTFSSIKIEVRVKSEQNEKKLQKILSKTMKTCPVGLLFEAAGVNIESVLIKN